jgi:hypothetical protein
VTTVVSLVHAAYIITQGGIPEVIAGLVEDCMSLTVANLPIVAMVSFRRISGASSFDITEDNAGQRWHNSALKFRTWTSRPHGATTHVSIGFIPGLSRDSASIRDTTELTSTTLDLTRKSSMPVHSVGTLDPDEVFIGAKPAGERDENVDNGKDRGVVRIDMLPYPREPPSSET